MAMELATEPAFHLGELTIRPSTREIVHPDGREAVEPRVMEVLLVLVRAGGEVVSRDRLIEACWGGRAVSEDAINRVISRIRRLAGLAGGRGFSLETIPKIGYRLLPYEAPAQPLTVPPAAFASEPAPASRSARKPRMWLGLAAAAALAVILAAGIWRFWPRPAPVNAPDATLTLAVMPFDDLGPGRQDAPLATGMSREIRNTLSRVRGLRVVSDASSFAVAAQNIPAPEIGKRLNADLLLDGSLARDGDTMRLTAELVDARSGVNLWTGSQSGPAADLDRLRQQMSASIFEQLVVRIGPKRLVSSTPPRHSDPKVYRLLLEAREALQAAQNLRVYPSRIEEQRALGDKAVAFVDRALAIDPDDAWALGLKGQIMTGVLVHEDRTLTARERRENAADYLRRALVADPDNVMALTGLGDHYRRVEWRWADAKAMLERALALDPNQSDTHLVYTYFLTTTGRCLDAAQHARSVNEIDPEFAWSTLGLPRALKCAGGETEANKLYLRQLAANPDEAFLVREIYLNYLERRDIPSLQALPDAVRQANGGKALQPPVEAMLVRAKLAADALQGRPLPYRERLEQDVAKDLQLYAQGRPNDQGRFAPDMMWMHAIEFAVAGAPSRAVDMLESAVSHGSLYIPETLPYGAYEFTPEVRNDPRYQAIWRSDPRLQELVRMRLEALKAGQMMGVAPDGTRVTPQLPNEGDARRLGDRILWRRSGSR